MAASNENDPLVSFSHVQLYVDHVESLQVYKALEDKLNAFAEAAKGCSTLEEKKTLWTTTHAHAGLRSTSTAFCPENRDVVLQLLSSFGFRVTGALFTNQTRSVLVTSRDPKGVQIIVTASVKNPPDDEQVVEDSSTPPFGIFAREKVQRFLDAHGGRQGVGVLAFAVANVRIIRARYQQLHSALFASYEENQETGTKILEVFACYARREKNDAGTEQRQADRGTVLRFVEFGSDESSDRCSALGLIPIGAVFDTTSQPAYCDHWVSNVFDRTEFLSTLEDTLGFMPKVDFNAGVVAAGEAQIESTVTGNASAIATCDKEAALRDQSQVYLPINNALSSVGHVHGFLEELGQGVQHVASRVGDLIGFVQRGNEYREVTGEGFSFLRIPRSYYGVLTAQQLTQGIVGDQSDAVSELCAEAITSCLEASNLLSKEGALDLEIGSDELHIILGSKLNGPLLDEFRSKKDAILAVVLRSRYKNLYGLLRDNISEEQYLGIVRNQILVDIQGDDLLYQIFTCNMLQRKSGDEAPFFEFIQRVCSECVIKPGCGGFGIRNFLTLFLSIEVSKAMQEVADAKEAGDLERQTYAQQMVDYFTEQLTESNPILTEISEAMTEEGRCQEEMAACLERMETDIAEKWKAKMLAAAERKRDGNARLMHTSARYNNLMKSLRKLRHKRTSA